MPVTELLVVGDTDRHALPILQTILNILRDVVSGMTFLHLAQPPVLHNDLKSQNLLIDANLHAKVADFGEYRSRSRC